MTSSATRCASYSLCTPPGSAGPGRAYTARYESDPVLDEVYFAWAGSTDAGEPHYYRVQGASILIEYDNTQRHANHAHSVWRDLTSDFGLDALAEHRAHTAHD